MEKSFGGQWFNKYEHTCKYDVAESFVEAFTLEELCQTVGKSSQEFAQELMNVQLIYGKERCGLHSLRAHIADTYQTMTYENILTTHAGVGANQLVFSYIKETYKQSNAVCITPTYQQLLSLPQMIFDTVHEYELNKDNEYCIDYQKLASMMDENTKLIIMCNPNNPYGKIFTREELQELADFARQYDCYILCDEIYEGLGLDGLKPQTSICEVYEKGLTSCSLSKAFSCPGLRLGWLACAKELVQEIADLRHYYTMENSVVCETIADLVLANKQKVLARNNQIINDNYQYFLNWVSNFPTLRHEKPQGGPVMMVYYDYPMDSYTFAKNLVEDHGVLVMPGVAFGLEGCFRIGLVARPEKFHKALDVFAQYLKTLN